MGKSTKKSHKYLLAVPAVLLLLPTLLFIALRLPPVQTYIVGRITKHLSGELAAHIATGRIEFRFFNRLIVNDILVRDQNNDTLLYAKQLRAGIRRIDPRNGNIRLGRIAAIEPRFALITDTSGQMNLNWLLSRLRNEPDTLPGRKFSLSIQQIEINNGSFHLVNKGSEKGRQGIDFSNLHVDSLNAMVDDLRIAGDTVAMDFYNMSFRESSGFSARAVRSNFAITGENLFFSSVQVLTDSSVINVPRVYITSDSAGFDSRFTETAKLDIVIDNSLVSSNDLRYFVPFFSKLEDVIGVRGRVAGTIAELRGRDLEFSYGDATSLALDFDFSGLPDLQNSFIYLGISSLTTNATDLRSVRLKGGKAIKIPPASDKLGTLSAD
ncbi:MAG: hypothetical protein MUE32_10395, partial [Bacteroidales bacterium]|nr:hypothetical protein [Bacteroidales bacterium]